MNKNLNQLVITEPEAFRWFSITHKKANSE